MCDKEDVLFDSLLCKTEALRCPLDKEGDLKARKLKGREDKKPAVLAEVPKTPECAYCKTAILPGMSLISCTLCRNSWHGACVDLTPQQVTAARRLGLWQCTWCKQCLRCTVASDDENMVLCDVCDSAYHIYCLEPMLAEIPVGSWKCVRCVQCVYCHSRSSKSWWEDYTVCDNCNVKKRRGLVCPVCKMPDNEQAPSVSCVACKKWVHVNGSCDEGAVTKAEWEKLQSGKTSFTCKICKSKTSSPAHDESLREQLKHADIDRLLEEQLKTLGSHRQDENRNNGASSKRENTAVVVMAKKKKKKKKRKAGADDDSDAFSNESDDSFDDSAEYGSNKKRPTRANTDDGVPYVAAPKKSLKEAIYKCEHCDRMFTNKQARATHTTITHIRKGELDFL